MSKGSYKDMLDDKDGVIRSLLTVFGFDPKKEHSVQAVKQLEDLINARYPQGHEPLPTTLIPFGVYLTQTLMKLLPKTELKADVDSVWDIEVSYKPKWCSEKDGPMVFYPFRRVDKFWKNREDTMTSLIETGQLIAENHPDSFEELADEEGWIKLPSGTMFRALVAKTDDRGNPEEEPKVRMNVSKIIKGI